MTLIEKLSNLGGIVDRDEMAKACSEIPDEDLRLALMTLALTYDQNIKINEEIFQKQSREIERLQKVALELRHSRKLVPFCGKNVQFKINKVFFDSSHLCDLLKGGESCMRVLKVLQKLVVFQGTVCAGAVGWQRSFHLKPVGVKFIEADWLQHIII